LHNLTTNIAGNEREKERTTVVVKKQKDALFEQGTAGLLQFHAKSG